MKQKILLFFIIAIFFLAFGANAQTAKLAAGVKCGELGEAEKCAANCESGYAVTRTEGAEAGASVENYLICGRTTTTDAAATSELKYKLLETIPGFYAQGSVMTDLPGLILAIYKFGTWTVGIAGLFMVVIGGFMYMASAGNNATAENAKKIIQDALLGIVAALAAYLIMYVINPDLTRINIDFTKVSIEESSGSGGSTAGYSAGNTTGSTTKGPCAGTTAGCCKPGISCMDCKNCTNFSNGYSNLCYTGGGTSCKLNSALVDKLNKANLASVDAEVSEAWPPSVFHKSLCHQDGTCADVRCKKGCKNEGFANVRKIYDALRNAGLNPIFESYNCAPYSSIGIKCAPYSTMTSPSFHVNLP